LCSQLGDADLAVDLISKSIEINPRVAEYHNYLGNSLKRLGRENEVEKSCGRAIDLNSHFNLGQVLTKQKGIAKRETRRVALIARTESSQ
jgi:tetratricopeptide (TPR) repeat protein